MQTENGLAGVGSVASSDRQAGGERTRHRHCGLVYSREWLFFTDGDCNNRRAERVAARTEAQRPLQEREAW